MFDISSERHLVNKANLQGERPLYVACKHGHHDVVKLLLKNGSNPHLLSQVEEEEKENLLEVTGRWSHVGLLEFLLETIAWEPFELNKALENQGLSEPSKQIIKCHIKKRKVSLGCCLCCRRT